MSRNNIINFCNNKNSIILIASLFFLYSFYLTLSGSLGLAEGHFSHLAHYNNGDMGIGNRYLVMQQMEPEYTKPNELSQIQFSIQNENGTDSQNIVTMVELYSTSTGERVAVFPWAKMQSGDFQIPYIFSKIGNYQIVLSLLNDDAQNTDEIINTVPPVRVILGDTSNCECDRAVFNITIAESFGLIFTTVVYGAAIFVVVIVGSVLSWMYLSRRKSKTNPISNDEFIKYSVLFLAIGAAIIHLAVFSEHGALRLEYSIFLISAAGGQLLYGLSYILLIFSDDKLTIKKTDKKYISKEYYKKSLILNYIGLVGSLVLIFLFLYSVIFPPPLSPNTHPEDIDIAGIIDKALEITLVVGIIYLMKSEKKRYAYSRYEYESKDVKE